MSFTRKYILLVSLLLVGCSSPNLYESRIDARHNFSSYYAPSRKVNPKDDLMNYTRKDLASPIEDMRKGVEDRLDYLLPLNPKLGRPKNVKAKPGIFWEVSWNRFIDVIFPESQLQQALNSVD